MTRFFFFFCLFFNTLNSFVSYHTSLSCKTRLTLLLVFVSFLINYCENGVCKVYYSPNISEYEEDLLSYPKVVIKKETFTANHGSFPQDFHKEFSEHEVFHKVQRSSVWTHELLC